MLDVPNPDDLREHLRTGHGRLKAAELDWSQVQEIHHDIHHINGVEWTHEQQDEALHGHAWNLDPRTLPPVRGIPELIAAVIEATAATKAAQATEKEAREELVRQLDMIGATGSFHVAGHTVSLVRKKPPVIFGPGWTKWVTEHKPDEVTTVYTTTVRPSFQQALTEALERGMDLPEDLLEAASFVGYGDVPPPYLRVVKGD